MESRPSPSFDRDPAPAEQSGRADVNRGRGKVDLTPLIRLRSGRNDAKTILRRICLYAATLTHQAHFAFLLDASTRDLNIHQHQHPLHVNRCTIFEKPRFFSNSALPGFHIMLLDGGSQLPEKFAHFLPQPVVLSGPEHQHLRELSGAKWFDLITWTIHVLY